MSDTGRIVCFSSFDEDNGKTIRLKGRSTEYAMTGIISDRKCIFDNVPTRERYNIQIPGTYTREVVIPAQEEGEEDTIQTVTEETIEFDHDIILTSDGYAEVQVGLNIKTFQGIKNIVNAGLHTKYLRIGMEVPMTLLDGSNHPMVVAAFDHDPLYPQQVIFVSKYALQYDIQFNTIDNITGGWNNMSMCRALNGGRFWSLLPDDVKPYISERFFETAPAAADNLAWSCSKIWIPRQREVHITRYNSLTSEDSKTLQFPYFLKVENRIKALKAQGQVSWWWTCSVYRNASGATHYVVYVADTGAIADTNPANKGGAVPCFHIIPDGAEPNGIVLGEKVVN